jgi:hypothetical protein
MEHVMPRHVTNRSAAGNGIFYEIRADSYVTKQYKNYWNRCFLFCPSRGYIRRTNGTSQK